MGVLLCSPDRYGTHYTIEEVALEVLLVFLPLLGVQAQNTMPSIPGCTWRSSCYVLSSDDQ